MGAPARSRSTQKKQERLRKRHEKRVRENRVRSEDARNETSNTDGVPNR